MGFTKSHGLMVLGLASLLGGSKLANAAQITWAGQSLINGPSDVSLQGTRTYAYSLGNNVSPVVNGVLFVAAVSDGSSFDYSDSNVLLHNYIQYGGFNAPPTVSDSQYTSLLTSAGYAPGATNAMTFTLNVTQGQTYQLQVWANDARAANFAATETMTDPSSGLGNLTISQNYANGFGGSFNIGTFTADGTTQQLTFLWSTGNNNQTSQVNAFQLRNITPAPEPASGALIGFGAAGLLARRRRVIS